jgi:hypothetical protein
MRKIIMRDGAGGEYQMEAGETQTLARLESSYRGMAGLKNEELLFADADSRQILGDKSQSIGSVWPGLGTVVILVLPDTLNAGDGCV